jgi:UDP-N-acetylglucosamine 2-epimerase (non-hydrolysing)
MRLYIVLGTRPEAIKLAPVILAARAQAGVEVTVCHTGQHADMCQSVLDLFGITPEIDLAVMKPGQSLPELTGAVLGAMDARLAERQPDWLLVQGDTTTAVVAALAAFYRRIPVGHVEAGLRTGCIYAPWPEEMNRRLISTIGSLHFAPVASNADNLRREGIDPQSILVTGNTGIDALKWLLRRIDEDGSMRARAEAALDAVGLRGAGAETPLVLITAHRRESFGEGFVAICRAIAALAARFPDRQFIYPVHPNPAVRATVYDELGRNRPPNVRMIEPLDYLPFIVLLSRAELVLTDSGGIQEEAPSLGARVIVMRQVTERPEGIDTAHVRLTGTDPHRIIAAAEEALQGRWPAVAAGRDLYGDGRAAERIAAALIEREARDLQSRTGR